MRHGVISRSAVAAGILSAALMATPAKAYVEVSCQGLSGKTKSRCLNCDGDGSPTDDLKDALKALKQAVGGSCVAYDIKIRGTIVKRDYLYFSAAWELPPKFKLYSVEIDTGGGDVSTALEIGDYLYNNRLHIKISKCYSACVFIITGAIRRFWFPKKSDVAIHDIFPTDVYAYDDYESWVRSRERFYKKLTKFFNKYRVSNSVVDLMKVTPSSKLLHLTEKELIRYGLLGENNRFQDHKRFQITKKCGKGDYKKYTAGESKILRECAPTLSSKGE